MSPEELSYALQHMQGVDGPSPLVAPSRIEPRAAKRGDKALKFTLLSSSAGVKAGDVPLLLDGQSSTYVSVPSSTQLANWLSYVKSNPIEVAGILVVAPTADVMAGLVVKTARTTPFDSIVNNVLPCSSYLRSTQYQLTRVELPIVSELDGFSHLIVSIPDDGGVAFSVSVTLFIRARSEIRDRLTIGEAPAIDAVGGAR